MKNKYHIMAIKVYKPGTWLKCSRKKVFYLIVYSSFQTLGHLNTASGSRIECFNVWDLHWQRNYNNYYVGSER